MSKDIDKKKPEEAKKEGRSADASMREATVDENASKEGEDDDHGKITGFVREGSNPDRFRSSLQPITETARGGTRRLGAKYGRSEAGPLAYREGGHSTSGVPVEPLGK